MIVSTGDEVTYLDRHRTGRWLPGVVRVIRPARTGAPTDPGVVAVHTIGGGVVPRAQDVRPATEVLVG